MATLDDLQDVLKSIDNTMIEQKDLLSTFITSQQTANRLSSVNTSVVQPTTGQSVGAAAAGIGQGVGAAATGLGLGGLAALAGLAMFANFDAQAIKDNVVTLLSISDEVGGKAEFFKEGGTFFAAMTGLGIGLAAFGIGQSLVGLGQWITDDQWTKTLKSNVADLLSIADGPTENASLLFEGGIVGSALGGLGIGLAAFGIGQSLTGLGQWLTDTDWAEKVKENVATLISIGGLEGIKDFSSINFAGAMTALAAGLSVFSIGNAAAGLAQFVSTDNWAEQVKNNVETLLSIADLPGMKDFTTINFAGAMTALGAGLLAFSVGAGASGIAEIISDWGSGGDWPEEVKRNVQTLLSITQLEGIGSDTIAFASIMTGIGAGLLAFSTGAGVASITDLIADWVGGGDQGSWADEVKNNVATLLSIPGLAAGGDIDEFTNIMDKLGDGLSSFAGGNFVGTLKNAGAAIVAFFFGTESPFEQIRDIYENSDKLKDGADALDKLTVSLEKIGALKFDGSKLNIKAFAEELAEAIPVIESAIMGGTIEKFGLFNDLEFKGLASPEIDYSTAIDNIKRLKEALGVDAQTISGGGGEVTTVGGPKNDTLSDSLALAVAESPVISPGTERVMLESQAQTIRNFQERSELVENAKRNEKSQPVAIVDSSSKTDARTYVGGTTNTTIITPRSSNDLDYGLPRAVM